MKKSHEFLIYVAILFFLWIICQALFGCSEGRWIPGNKPLHDQREYIKAKHSTKKSDTANFYIGYEGYHLKH